MMRQRGFIALYALLMLTFLVAIVALVQLHSNGLIDRHRHQGGRAAAERAAYGAIARVLFEDRTRTPRLWIPPMDGELDLGEGIQARWSRYPVEGRWYFANKTWSPLLADQLRRLGANAPVLDQWRQWLEAREAGDPALGLRGKWMSDRNILTHWFRALQLEEKWRSPDRIWTMDEEGSVGRLNLLGADPGVLAVLSGVGEDRIRDVQSSIRKGVLDAASLSGLWRFDEAQAIETCAVARPPAVCKWVVEVRLPQLKDPVLTQWRTSLDDGTPGSPWFRVLRQEAEAW